MSDKSIDKSRRNFIKTGVSGLAGAALVPSMIKKSDILPYGRQEDRKIIYRTLGKTGIKVPIVSMGTYNATSVTNAALDAGITHFDTSADYQQGNDEKFFGEVFKERPRDSFVIGTSIGMWKYRAIDEVKQAVTPAILREYIDGSLERLGLDYIDIYYLGGVKNKEILLHEPYLDILQEYKQAGKLKYLGVTTHSNEEEMIREATDSGIYDIVLTQYNFKCNNREGIKSAIKYAADKGIGIVAMKTQAGVYWNRVTKANMINMKAALKWVLQDENVHTAVPSFANIEQMNEAMSVMEDLELTAQEKTDLKLDQGDEDDRTTALFCSQCQECIPQCPSNLDIPTLMRSYMYAYGYEQPAKARETLDYVNFANYKCNDCDTCRVTCSTGFDVKRKLTDIARLKDVPREFLI